MSRKELIEQCAYRIKAQKINSTIRDVIFYMDEYDKEHNYDFICQQIQVEFFRMYV